MDHFLYRDGALHAEDVPVARIAGDIGTPFYCYSTATLTRHYRVFSDAFAGQQPSALICFAVKANSNLAVLRTLAGLGAGADTVSEGEIRRALAAGVPPKKIVFSGVGKTEDEMRYALSAGIGQFNAESAEELETLNRAAGTLGKKAPVAVRVNPDVDAASHDKISTGRKHDKFGVAWDQAASIYAKAAALPNLDVTGVATHIGSQLTDLQPFRQAFGRLAGLVKSLRGRGHAIRTLDLGGGLGIPYSIEMPPHPADYAAMIIEAVRDLDCQLILEPGRLICGNAGILVTRVIRVKTAPERTFIIVDAAMNDLARPALYGAHHEIVPVLRHPDGAKESPVDIVGPVCETADIFGRGRMLPDLREGDLLAIRSAGAYGAVMSSAYNSRPLIAEVMVKGDRYGVIRPRQTYEAMLGLDRLPDWIGAAG